MGFSEAVQWWEEWQLRVLVFTSLFLQWFLYFAGLLRKRRIHHLVRCFIWLAYLSNDAVAIYSLATLFNRQRRQEEHQSSARLQALWAPILLIHLGGQDTITAYNVEDNELWMRHALRAVSQVAVAVYAFRKSWSVGDSRFLVAVVLLFFVGTLKCMLRPWALKRVSINGLMNTRNVFDIYPWYEKGFIKAVRDNFPRGGDAPHPSASVQDADVWKPHHLLVDLPQPHSLRTLGLRGVWRNHQEAHRLVRYGLSAMFDKLYTKEPLLLNLCGMCSGGRVRLPRFDTWFGRISFLQFLVTVILLPTIICEFRFIHKETDDPTDVVITYILLSLTIALECFVPLLVLVMHYRRAQGFDKVWWPDQVRQHNLIWYLARNRNHSKPRRLMTLLGCKDYIDQELWCMKPSESSPEITKIVHDYLDKGWGSIEDVATYRAFNDIRGQWTLHQEECDGSQPRWRSLRWSFDHCVLAWHLATDLCFHLAAPSASSQETARLSREMSNYMAYLAFVNPEMLMTGARSFLFREAYRQVKEILKLPLPDNDAGPSRPDMPPTQEGEIAWNIICRERQMNCQGDYFGIVSEACRLYKHLKELVTGQDDTKMWRVIKGVWVEMLCFSGGRCRGYLHAKSTDKGGEFLSSIWLLMFHMGMETLAHRVERVKLEDEDEAPNNLDGTTTGGGGGDATGNGHEDA